MKELILYPKIFLLFFLLLPMVGYSQDIQKTQPSEAALKKVATEIISAAKTCALITVDNEGLPRARTMDPFPPDENFTVWFGTNKNSRKVNQIKNNPNVTFYYLDKDESCYVMINGKAELVDEANAKEKWWKKSWESFYPDKKSYLLIKVTPVTMEISSAPRGITGDLVSWQPPAVEFK